MLSIKNLHACIGEKQILKEMKRLEKAMHDSAQNLECEEYISDNPEEYSITTCGHCDKILNP
jgi:hypothetical protein